MNRFTDTPHVRAKIKPYPGASVHADFDGVGPVTRPSAPRPVEHTDMLREYCRMLAAHAPLRQDH